MCGNCVEMNRQKNNQPLESRYAIIIRYAPDNGTVFYFIPSEFNVFECRPNACAGRRERGVRLRERFHGGKKNTRPRLHSSTSTCFTGCFLHKIV